MQHENTGLWGGTNPPIYECACGFRAAAADLAAHVERPGHQLWGAVIDTDPPWRRCECGFSGEVTDVQTHVATATATEIATDLICRAFQITITTEDRAPSAAELEDLLYCLVMGAVQLKKLPRGTAAAKCVHDRARSELDRRGKPYTSQDQVTEAGADARLLREAAAPTIKRARELAIGHDAEITLEACRACHARAHCSCIVPDPTAPNVTTYEDRLYHTIRIVDAIDSRHMGIAPGQPSAPAQVASMVTIASMVTAAINFGGGSSKAIIEVPLEAGGTVVVRMGGLANTSPLYACATSGKLLRTEACPDHPGAGCTFVGYDDQADAVRP